MPPACPRARRRPGQTGQDIGRKKPDTGLLVPAKGADFSIGNRSGRDRSGWFTRSTRLVPEAPSLGSFGWVDSVDLQLDVVGVAQDDEGVSERGLGGWGVLDSGLVKAAFPLRKFADGRTEGQVVESGVGFVERVVGSGLVLDQPYQAAVGQRVQHLRPGDAVVWDVFDLSQAEQVAIERR